MTNPSDRVRAVKALRDWVRTEFGATPGLKECIAFIDTIPDTSLEVTMSRRKWHLVARYLSHDCGDNETQEAIA